MKSPLHCNPFIEKGATRELRSTHKALLLDHERDATSFNKHILSPFLVRSTLLCAGNREKGHSAHTATCGR